MTSLFARDTGSIPLRSTQDDAGGLLRAIGNFADPCYQRSVMSRAARPEYALERG
jgi:hypothetical protein